MDTTAPQSVYFDGATPGLDSARLAKQHERIRDLMRDGIWRTLAEIARVTGDHEASISAQLRHLRKPRFGAWLVHKRRRGTATRGLYEYQLIATTEGDCQ